MMISGLQWREEHIEWSYDPEETERVQELTKGWEVIKEAPGWILAKRYLPVPRDEALLFSKDATQEQGG